MANVFTIGFTQKSAAEFFALLRKSSATKLLDVRLNNTSQLAGFAKRDDLRFFLKELCAIDYVEVADLTPEPAMLKDYRNKLMPWDEYASRYVELIEKRSVERKLDPGLLADACLLCSEHQPHHCHRRLAVDYLRQCWTGPWDVTHLV